MYPRQYPDDLQPGEKRLEARAMVHSVDHEFDVNGEVQARVDLRFDNVKVGAIGRAVVEDNALKLAPETVEALKNEMVAAIDQETRDAFFPTIATTRTSGTDTTTGYVANNVILRGCDSITGATFDGGLISGGAFANSNAISDNWLGDTLANNQWLTNTAFTTDATTNSVYIRAGDYYFQNPITINTDAGGTIYLDGNFHFPFEQQTALSGISFVRTEESERERRRRKLREQWQPDITKLLGHRPRALGEAANFRYTKQNEMLALQLLRSMVSPDVFRKYLRYGFVAVQGPSGMTYQITRKSHMIDVWERGVKIARLCVYLRDNTIPPTDEVVAKMLICECDEPDIWSRANITWKVGSVQSQDVASILGIERRGHHGFALGQPLLAVG